MGAYRNTFGAISRNAALGDGRYDLCLTEQRSGLFALESISGGKVPNAKRMRVLCPWHDQHELRAINSDTLICTECDPRLEP